MGEHGGLLEIPYCLCGLPMVALEKFGDVFVCNNCDLPHKGITPEDKVRNEATKKQYGKWFPDQPTKEI